MGIGARRYGHVCDQQIAGAEAWLDILQPVEAAQQKARADQQHDGESNLADHEQPAQLLLGAAAGGSARAFIQRRDQIEPDRLQRRTEAEQQRCEHHHAADEQQHALVHFDRSEIGDAGAGERHQRRNRGIREQHSGRSARNREQRAFREQLAQQAGTAGAQGGPHRDLAPARGGAREQQVRDIGASDQQDRADRAQEDEQARADVVHDLIVHAVYVDSDARIGGGILQFQPPRNGGHLGARGIERYAGPQPSDRDDPGMPRAIVRQCRPPTERTRRPRRPAVSIENREAERR